MERYQLRFLRRRRPEFDELPAGHRRTAFGVDYAWVRGLQGGEIFFTRHGWAIAESLLPEFWYDEERYRRVGQALTAGTGAVYHVPMAHPRRARFGLVVKFCRFGQNVGLTVVGRGANFDWSRDLLEGAEFSDPFSEFGHLQVLRNRAHGRIRTKRPLAIYCPAAHYPAWQLGRTTSTRWCTNLRLADDQAGVHDHPRIQLEWERVYILVYQWIDGIDLAQAERGGWFDAATVASLTRATARELFACSFAVLDHKPSHIIVRPDRRANWLRHHNDLAWALVDYELLVPNPLAATPDASRGMREELPCP